MIELYSHQEESVVSNLNKIIDRLKKPTRSNAPDPDTFASPGFKTFAIPEPPLHLHLSTLHPLRWQPYQEILSTYFIKKSQPSSPSLRNHPNSD
jgi:hypothetical protein